MFPAGCAVAMSGTLAERSCITIIASYRSVVNGKDVENADISETKHIFYAVFALTVMAESRAFIPSVHL